MRERADELEAARRRLLRTLLRDARKATDPKVLQERCRQLGVPFDLDGGRHRGEGSKQTDLARVLGLSAEHYARLERGDLPHVQPWTLELLAHALGLDDVHHRLLFDLVNGYPPTTPKPASQAQRAAARRQLQVLDPVPAALTDCGWNPLEVNAAFELWFGAPDLVPEDAVNFVYFAFTELAASFRAYQDLERERRELIGRVLAAWPRHRRCPPFKALIARLQANPLSARMLDEAEAREPNPARLGSYHIRIAPDPVEVATLNLELPGNLRLIVLKPAIQRMELLCERRGGRDETQRKNPALRRHEIQHTDRARR